MAFRTQKISQMTPKGADLEATDLIEVSTIESGSYVTRSITGQELIDAIPLPPTGLTVGTTPIASGTIGRVLFQGTGNVLQQSSSLFWDSTNNRLGIGTATPTQTLDINGVSIFRDTIFVSNQGRISWGGGFFNIFADSSNGLSLHTPFGRVLSCTQTTGNVLINTTTDAGFRLDVNGTARVQGNAQFGTGFYWDNTNNRLGIGTATPTHGISHVGTIGVASFFSQRDFGFNTISQITQRAYFYGRHTSNLDSGIGIGGNVRGNTSIQSFNTNTNTATLLSLNYYGGNVIIGDYSADAGFRLDVNGTARVQGALTVTSNITISSGAGVTAPFFSGTANNFQFGISGVFGTQSNSVAVASGLRSSFIDSMTWVQSSGTGEYASFRATPTYNTTGTYSGIVRGFHYAPTLTSLVGVTAHYAFHSTAGRIRFENLPTSATGLSAGDIWNDGGTLKIV
jgi:hypothetical protein